MHQVKVLFVCLGNICRSPTAQGVFEKLVADKGLSHRILIDSAGTSAYHVGEPPDRRAMRSARRRGIDLSDQRSRRTTARDCETFDYILAMDRDNYRALQSMCTRGNGSKVQLFLDYAPQLNRVDVPDPYYGGPNGFEDVLDLIEAAAEGLLEHIKQQDLGSS